MASSHSSTPQTRRFHGGFSCFVVCLLLTVPVTYYFTTVSSSYSTIFASVTRLANVASPAHLVTVTKFTHSAIVATSVWSVTVSLSAHLAIAPPPFRTSEFPGSAKLEHGLKRSTCLTNAHPPALLTSHGCSDELCASPITSCKAPPSAGGLRIYVAAPGSVISNIECSSSIRPRFFNAAAIVTRHLYTSDTSKSYVTFSTYVLPRLYRALTIFWELVCTQNLPL